MLVADIFRPAQWNDFFLLVGTGAVTLTGLVFVAMSLNLKRLPSMQHIVIEPSIR